MSCPASKELVHAVGMKATKAGEVQLRVLEASNHPLTVDEIYNRLVQLRLGRPTIYRNLKRFIQEGWAESFVDKNQIQRFLRCGTTEHQAKFAAQQAATEAQRTNAEAESKAALAERLTKQKAKEDEPERARKNLCEWISFIADPDLLRLHEAGWVRSSTRPSIRQLFVRNGSEAAPHAC